MAAALLKNCIFPASCLVLLCLTLLLAHPRAMYEYSTKLK